MGIYYSQLPLALFSPRLYSNDFQIAPRKEIERFNFRIEMLY